MQIVTFLQKVLSVSRPVALVMLVSLGLVGLQSRIAVGQTPDKKQQPATLRPEPASIPVLEHKTFPQGPLYILKVPAHSAYKVTPLVSKTLATVESKIWQTQAQPKQPLFLINGGFFDPNNSLTTSFIFQKGVMTADPRINPQLVNNSKLIPYLPRVFNRSEFRVYLCSGASEEVTTRYDIAMRNAEVPKGCLLESSLGAGPALLPLSTEVEEAFVDYDASGKVIRDPIGVCARNARSVLGITEAGDVLIMMGAQDPKNPAKSGFTLAEMAGLLKARGAVQAIALDGGSSSSIWHEGKPIYGRLTRDGALVKRPVKSVLMVAPR